MASGLPIWRLTEKSECQTTASCDGTADEILTTYAYDGNLRVQSMTVAAGNGSVSSTTTYGYDAVGNLVLTNGPLSGTADRVRHIFDAARQEIGTINPDPDGSGARLYAATRTTYNLDGQPTVVERGTATNNSDTALSTFSSLQKTTNTYDLWGRLTRERRGVGSSVLSFTQYTYDTRGRLQCTALRMNPAEFGSPPSSACTLDTAGAFGPDRITRNTYDDADRLLTTTRGYGVDPIVESQTWSANNQVLTRTDGEGNLSTYVYDGYDRVSRLRFPNPSGGGSSTTDYENYTYDAAGNVTAFRNRAGETISYTYDALNLKTLANAPSGTSDVSYTYDSLGRQRTAVSGGQTVTYTWNALSQLVSEAAWNGTTSYQYDLAGRRTRITWPGSPAYYVDYVLNVDGGVSQMRENGATSGAGLLASFTYDNLGRRTAVARGNGVSSSYGYDGLSRITSLAHNLTGTAQDVTFGYTYGPGGLATRTASNNSYIYTPANSSTAYVNNDRNQVTSAGGVAITYDAHQNMLNDGTQAYTYNAYNQLTQAGTRSLVYDPLARAQQIYDIKWGYSGTAIVGEYDSSTNAIEQRFVPGQGVDETVVTYTGSGTADRRWVLTDERGSAIAYTDATGAATTINRWDEYGIPASGNAGRFQYTGQTWLGSINLYSYKARFYQPTLGRFLQTDPTLYADGLNMYAYVANDPVNKTDPTGMCWGCLKWAAKVIMKGGDIAATTAGVAADVRTLTAGNSTLAQRGGALLSLGSEVVSPVSIRDGHAIAGAVGVALREGDNVTDVTVSASRHPEAARHIRDAQAAGQPDVLTIDRGGTAARRREAMGGTPARTGQDRDEYPPAMTQQGGAGSSVRHIDPSDNRGAGASIGAQCRDLPCGSQVRIRVE